MRTQRTYAVTPDLLAGLVRLIEPSRLEGIFHVLDQEDSGHADEVRSVVYAALPPGCMAERDYRGLHRMHRWFLGEMERLLGTGLRTLSAREIAQWLRISELEASTIRRALLDKGLLCTVAVSKEFWKPDRCNRNGKGWQITPRGKAVLEFMRLQETENPRIERSAEVVQLISHG